MKKIIFLSILIILVIFFSAEIKRGSKSVLILVDLMRPPGTSLMGAFFVEPEEQKVKIPAKGRMIPGVVYTGGKKNNQIPLLLVSGPDDESDVNKRFIALAKDLARAGFIVLLPRFENKRNNQLRVPDGTDVLETYHYLTRIGTSGKNSVLMGVDPGMRQLLAAVDSRIRDSKTRVHFLILPLVVHSEVRDFSLRNIYQRSIVRNWQRLAVIYDLLGTKN